MTKGTIHSALPRTTAYARYASKRAQAGAGLIEVMIAVLILSIGFLGMAALQAMSLSTNNSAMTRTMATIDSYSILDMMRADISNASSYNGPVTANSCPTATGTLAQSQLAQWCTRLAADFGATASTSGNIDCSTTSAASGATTTTCTVTIQFDDSRAGNGGASNQQVVTKGML